MQTFGFFFPVCISHIYRSAMVKASVIILAAVVKSGYICFILNIKGKVFNSSLLSLMLAMSFYILPLLLRCSCMAFITERCGDILFVL